MRRTTNVCIVGVGGSKWHEICTWDAKSNFTDKLQAPSSWDLILRCLWVSGFRSVLTMSNAPTSAVPLHDADVIPRGSGSAFYEPLISFVEMWYQIFLWALFSSIFVHTIAAAICFATLRKHKYGKFFPLLIIIMGVLLPLTSGILSSGAVAFVYQASGYQMLPLYALLWGIGQTVMAACVGFTRILATL